MVLTRSGRHEQQRSPIGVGAFFARRAWLLWAERVIPVHDVTATVPSPVPTCSLPPSEEISEEGFGYFRGSWLLGRVAVADAESVVSEEAEILTWLDHAAGDSRAFEVLATAIEGRDAAGVAEALVVPTVPNGLDRFVGEWSDDFSPLGGLEVGVAGLSHALSAIGCLTAASCRSHATPHSWSDVPIVFFRAPTWRVELLAELMSSEACGLEERRDMLTIYAASVRDTHALARHILGERSRFRRKPERWRTGRQPSRRPHGQQMEL